MKHLVLMTIGLLLTMMSFAQEKPNWKEKENFHKVMSNVFHSIEKGNFTPLLERSGEMVKAAKSWKASAIPAGYDVAQIKPLLTQLLTDCKAVKKSVKKNAGNDVIKEKLVQAHETYHKVVGVCNHIEEN